MNFSFSSFFFFFLNGMTYFCVKIQKYKNTKLKIQNTKWKIKKIRKLISYEIEGNIEILLSIEVDGADATGFENNWQRQQQQQQRHHRSFSHQQSIGSSATVIRKHTQGAASSTSDSSDMSFNFPKTGSHRPPPKKPAPLLPMHDKNNSQHSFQSMHSRNSSNVSDLSDRSGDNSANNNLQSLVNSHSVGGDDHHHHHHNSSNNNHHSKSSKGHKTHRQTSSTLLIPNSLTNVLKQANPLSILGAKSMTNLPGQGGGGGVGGGGGGSGHHHNSNVPGQAQQPSPSSHSTGHGHTAQGYIHRQYSTPAGQSGFIYRGKIYRKPPTNAAPRLQLHMANDNDSNNDANNSNNSNSNLLLFGGKDKSLSESPAANGSIHSSPLSTTQLEFLRGHGSMNGIVNNNNNNGTRRGYGNGSRPSHPVNPYHHRTHPGRAAPRAPPGAGVHAFSRARSMNGLKKNRNDGSQNVNFDFMDNNNNKPEENNNDNSNDDDNDSIGTSSDLDDELTVSRTDLTVDNPIHPISSSSPMQSINRFAAGSSSVNSSSKTTSPFVFKNETDSFPDTFNNNNVENNENNENNNTTEKNNENNENNDNDNISNNENNNNTENNENNKNSGAMNGVPNTDILSRMKSKILTSFQQLPNLDASSVSVGSQSVTNNTLSVFNRAAQTPVPTSAATGMYRNGYGVVCIMLYCIVLSLCFVVCQMILLLYFFIFCLFYLSEKASICTISSISIQWGKWWSFTIRINYIRK